MQIRNRLLTNMMVLLLTATFLFNCSNGYMGQKSVFKKIESQKILQDAGTAYNKKDYSKAANLYEKVLMHEQNNFIVAYNLACCYALQGNADKASVFVRYAFANGFRNIKVFRKDPDFDPIRKDSEFKKAVKTIEARFQSIGTLDYVEASSQFPYRIRFPKDYDASKSYPLIIGMHGYGGNADGFISYYGMLKNPQVIYVTPEGQYPLSNDMGPKWHTRSWGLIGVSKTILKSADRMVTEYIINTINKVKSEYRISDVYIMGFSQGATFAYTIGLQNSDQVEGVIAFGGFLMDHENDESILSWEDIKQGKGLRLYIAHGLDDLAIKVEDARKLKLFFEEQGFDLTYQEFEGGHKIPPAVLNLAFEWIYDGAHKQSQ